MCHVSENCGGGKTYGWEIFAGCLMDVDWLSGLMFIEILCIKGMEMPIKNQAFLHPTKPMLTFYWFANV